MGGVSVVWAETPGDDREQQEENDTEAHVDETFAARRLRRWIKGMFGGTPEAGDEGARPRSGPGEEAPGEPGGSPDSD
jgi:hypothetical protein